MTRIYKIVEVINVFKATTKVVINNIISAFIIQDETGLYLTDENGKNIFDSNA